MTDDELERALFALPLEEPPIDLRGRIFAATIDRPRLAFSAWEIWASGTFVAFTVWLAFLVVTSVPDFGGVFARAISDGIDRCLHGLTPATLMWIGLGGSFVVWISALSLPPSRRELTGR